MGFAWPGMRMRVSSVMSTADGPAAAAEALRDGLTGTAPIGAFPPEPAGAGWGVPPSPEVPSLPAAEPTTASSAMGPSIRMRPKGWLPGWKFLAAGSSEGLWSSYNQYTRLVAGLATTGNVLACLSRLVQRDGDGLLARLDARALFATTV